MDASVKKPYRHGNLPNALRAAARTLLDEPGALDVGLREAARRVGVSATAAYRHFLCKEDLLASVAAEGFSELLSEMMAMDKGAETHIDVGLAYIEFARQKPGLFRLMFGPLLQVRAKYYALNKAAEAVFDLLEHSNPEIEDGQQGSSMAAWGLMHGLSSLVIDGVIPSDDARALARQMLRHAEKPTPALLSAA